jgi:hypothetical protein
MALIELCINVYINGMFSQGTGIQKSNHQFISCKERFLGKHFSSFSEFFRFFYSTFIASNLFRFEIACNPDVVKAFVSSQPVR